MKQGWEVKRLKDLLEVQNGYAFASSLFSASEGMPLIRIRDLKNGVNTKVNFTGEYNKDYIVQKGDFLIGMDGEFRCYEWAGDNALLNQRVCRLQNFEDSLLPKFLFYGVNKHLKDIEDVTSFTTVKHISSKKIKDIEFPIPPLEEQKQIVAKLDQCFEAIDKARANAAKNLENAKELFQSKLNDIFSQKGEGWVEKKLIDISKFIDYRGRTPKKTTEGVRLITAKNVKMGILNRNPQEFIHTDDYDDWMTRGIPNRNDVLFTTEAPLANVALLDTDERVALAQRIITLSVDQDIISGEYLCYCMQSKYVQDKILAKGTGATVTGIKAKLLKEIGIPVVDHKTQAKFVNNLNKLKEQTQSLESKYQQELNSLEELKKSILQKAFEGEL